MSTDVILNEIAQTVNVLPFLVEKVNVLVKWKEDVEAKLNSVQNKCYSLEQSSLELQKEVTSPKVVCRNMSLEHKRLELLMHAYKTRKSLSRDSMDLMLELQNFINGEFVECRRLADNFDPSNGKVYSRIPDSGKLEVDAAVAAAKRAFPEWSKLSAVQRATYLSRLANLLEDRSEEFAAAESKDQGKPVWLAKSLDIPRACVNIRHFASIVPHQLNTSNILVESSALNYTMREPVGVAGLISPWNLPLYLLTFKLAPALMAGNTVVAKPSEMTSVTAYMLCKLIQEAGFPKGVINMVFGTGKSAGEALVSHPDVPLISFTGSTATGRHIAQIAAPFFKKLSLEMGGKNAAIVFDDSDVDAAVTVLIKAAFINTGQVCLCSSRIFVQKAVYDDFLEKFVEQAKSLKVGSPKLDKVFLGPLNSKQHIDKVKRYVQYALEDGGKIHCGETVDILNIPEDLKDGYYMLPTVITNLADDTRCMQEEIFGPVTCISPFETEEEAISRANSTNYGLCASVWTKSLSRAHSVAHNLKAGTVWTNCWLVRDLNMPFGGVKQSGIGREGSNESIEFFTETKTVCTKF